MVDAEGGVLVCKLGYRSRLSKNKTTKAHKGTKENGREGKGEEDDCGMVH